jgi:flagellar motor component MotA
MDNIKKSTDFGTLLGLAAGISIIFIGINQSGGSLYWFFNLNSILIVVGGTFAATMVNLPLKALKNLPKILSNVFRADDSDYDRRNCIKSSKSKKRWTLITRSRST